MFQSHPFRPTEPAAEYITRTLAEESAASCEFDEPIADGDGLGSDPWRGRTLVARQVWGLTPSGV